MSSLSSLRPNSERAEPAASVWTQGRQHTQTEEEGLPARGPDRRQGEGSREWGEEMGFWLHR